MLGTPGDLTPQCSISRPPNGPRSRCRCGSRRRDAGGDAVRHRAGWLLARRDFLGQERRRCAGASAAGAAAGRHRLSAAADVRTARRGRRVARRPSRNRVRRSAGPARRWPAA